MAKLYPKVLNIFFHDSRRELLLYLCLWLLLFLSPLFSIYMRLSQLPSGSSFPWDELLLLWQQYAIFLLLFIVHNFLLAPLLVYRHRRALYFSLLAVMLGAFLVLQCGNSPHGKMGHHPHGEPPAFAERPPHEHGGHDRFGEHEDIGKRDNHGGLRHRDGGPRPPMVIGERDVMTTIIFILMLGMNLGVKFYFRQRKDHERMLQLEHDNLEQQLEYLKYQINPHFLMNTLNNIHALVDINPEQAKETIVELSKIMRFVLYEGNKKKVQLRQELIFTEHYIDLMKMRYSEQVTINVSMPDMIPDREIPPLLLITFVENAFKHGVSYQRPSFIDINISVNTSSLCFECRNSKAPQADDSHGGVGLQNARRRLELLYGKTYSLDIIDAADTYSVTLNLPL